MSTSWRRRRAMKRRERSPITAHASKTAIPPSTINAPRRTISKRGLTNESWTGGSRAQHLS